MPEVVLRRSNRGASRQYRAPVSSLLTSSGVRSCRFDGERSHSFDTNCRNITRVLTCREGGRLLTYARVHRATAT